MASIMELRVTAFIPEDWLYVTADPYNNYYGEGNNRDFTYWTENNIKLFKMAQHVVINWNTSTINVYKAVGPTRTKILNRATGQEFIKDYPLTSDANITYNNTVLTPTSASLSIRGSAGNSALPELSPAIDWEYNISVDRNTGSVTFNGRHDGFPNHEIYKRIDGGTPVELYRFYKKTLGHLVDPMDIEVVSQNKVERMKRVPASRLNWSGTLSFATYTAYIGSIKCLLDPLSRRRIFSLKSFLRLRGRIAVFQFNFGCGF